MTALTIERGTSRNDVPDRIVGLINRTISEKIRRVKSGSVTAAKATFGVTVTTDKTGMVKCVVTFSDGETRKEEWLPDLHQMNLPLDEEE